MNYASSPICGSLYCVLGFFVCCDKVGYPTVYYVLCVPLGIERIEISGICALGCTNNTK